MAPVEALLYLGGVLPGELLKELGIEGWFAELAANVLALIGLLAGGVTAIFKTLTAVRRRLLLRDPQERNRLRRRQLFASYVEGRVRELNRREEWSDYRFAELEAEVETVGDSAGRRGLRELFGGGDRLRREKSLSRALVRSGERLILLRGDPGSGKSVALRYVARTLAMEAMNANRTDEVIPLYVNLKDLHRGTRPVDVQLIEDFVLASVERGGDREVHRFLADEFAAGKAEGGWFFLFDSFDEIPEVLSSTEDDETVSAYSNAIIEFVQGMHACRGVIASRYFRAPQQQGLPTFRIVPLSERRKLDLVEKAEMGSTEAQLIADLRVLPPELTALSANPLFLGLLVEFVKAQEKMPEGWHDVFETFVSRRLKTDEERLAKLFQISTETLRRRSEEIAFTMTATDGFGLSPTKEALKAAYLEAGFAGAEDIDASLSALAWTKLARVDTEVSDSSEETFTFAHRRFQEYFATCVVLREPDRVDARTLLTDASWRETAVTLCHAQPENSDWIAEEAEVLLEVAERSIGQRVGSFSWPPGVLHLLSLLQSAFAGRPQYLPLPLRRRVAAVLRAADEEGTRVDRKWALEVVGTAPPDDMADLLLEAFRGESDWLREVAYRQVARLGEIPAELSAEIRRALIERAGRGELRRDWPATKAQLMRLRPAAPFVRAARLLRLVPTVDLSVFVLGLWGAFMVFSPPPGYALAWTALAVAAHLCYYPAARGIAGASQPDWTIFSVGLCRAYVSLMPLALAIAPEVVDRTGLTLALVPQEDLAHGGMLLPAIAWTYASSWSIAATFLSLRETPPVLSWPFIPLKLVGAFARWLWRRKFAPLLVGVAMAVGTIALVAGIGMLMEYTFDLLPQVVGLIVGIGLFLTYVGAMLASTLVRVARLISDWRRSNRWLRIDRNRITASELLEILSTLRTPRTAARVVREVRVRSLLEDDPQGAQLTRDLLQIVERPGQAAWAFASPALAGLSPEVKDRLGTLQGDVPDELGYLLESLERDGELPVA